MKKKKRRQKKVLRLLEIVYRSVDAQHRANMDERGFSKLLYEMLEKKPLPKARGSRVSEDATAF